MTAARADADRAIGVVIFVGATAVLFATLVLAYLVVRVESPAWPPTGTAALSLARPILGLAVLAASSASLFAALHNGAFRRGLIALAAVLGALFVAVQVDTWLHLRALGVGLASHYGAAFYVLSGVHALHAVAGIVALAGATSRARASLVGIYWHFIGVVWLFLVAAWRLP